MKNITKWIFFMAVIVFISSCKKDEGCTDARAVNFDPKADKENGTCSYQGRTTFWINSSSSIGPVDVYINGLPVGTITLGYASTPTCGANGSVTYTNSPGAYSFTAEEQLPGLGSWSGIVNITSDGCSVYELTE